jgi:hypothetical protein
MLNVSPRSVASARTVLDKGSPALQKAVEVGAKLETMKICMIFLERMLPLKLSENLAGPTESV